MLTGEYLVLDGTRALALPTRFGQKMQVETTVNGKIIWKSYSSENLLWYEDSFLVEKNNIIPEKQEGGESKKLTERLLQILKALRELNPKLFEDSGYRIETRLEFPRNWGLGSSSTLLTNLAEWAGVNPFELSEKTFGGSGYDIACGKSSGPILYKRKDPLYPEVKRVDFNPEFKENLFFIHLNQKQDSRQAIARYKELNPQTKTELVNRASALTDEFLHCDKLEDFNRLLVVHENLITSILKIPPVKESLFPDFPGEIKSLGAWGGDFILATGGKEVKTYFKQKGFSTILEYQEMVLG